MRHIPLRLWALVLLSSVLQLLAFPLAGPVPVGRRLFSWICLIPLLYALGSKDRRHHPLGLAASALLGYACGTAWFFGNCYWIYQTMNHYGGLPPVAAAGILVLFSLYLGLYFALFGWLFAAVRHVCGPRAALPLSPILWVSVELARTRITGFPWDLLGYTQVDNWLLTPLAMLTGVAGLSLLVASGNALFLWRPTTQTMAWRRWLGPALALVLASTGVITAIARPSPATGPAVAVLVQDNLAVGEDAGSTRETEAQLVHSFAWLAAHPTRSAALRPTSPPGTSNHPSPPDLIAWPEAPTDFADADPGLRAALGAVSRSQDAPLVVDAVGTGPAQTPRGQQQEFVSASFYLPDGSYAGRYDKMHLVPFGEYTPYKQLFFFAGHLLDGLNFVPGTSRRLFSVNGHRFGVFICYESIFGDEIRQFANRGAEVLVNLSDDGWYGDTSAPWEHLDMARMRAIENHRWLLRDTNTGLTASIDPKGRIAASMPRHMRGSVAVPFAFLRGTTFYTRHGEWVGLLCTIFTTAVVVGGWLQRRFPRAGRAATVH